MLMYVLGRYTCLVCSWYVTSAPSANSFPTIEAWSRLTAAISKVCPFGVLPSVVVVAVVVLAVGVLLLSALMRVALLYS